MDATPTKSASYELRPLLDAIYLEHAAQQAHARNYQDFLIVDVDAHHYENESYKEVFQYIENPVIRHDAMDSAQRPGRSACSTRRSATKTSAAASPAQLAQASESAAGRRTATSS